jgi:hypothetical protein
MVPPESLDLTRRLLAYEALAGRTSAPAQSAALRVYEKLRRPLFALVGVAGFRSLARRALTLAQAETSTLSAVQVTTDGSLQGLGEHDQQIEKPQAGEGEAILIAQLLGLLSTFIGIAFTLRLVQDAWPDAAFDDPNSGIGGKHEPTR